MNEYMILDEFGEIYLDNLSEKHAMSYLQVLNKQYGNVYTLRKKDEIHFKLEKLIQYMNKN